MKEFLIINLWVIHGSLMEKGKGEENNIDATELKVSKKM